MNGIGIVGSGIAGLQLGLFLQQHGIPATIYSDRTPEQIRAGRLPNSVARFEHTRARDRQLGVDHWDSPDLDVNCVHFYLGSSPPLVFRGDLKRPGCFVDMRIYLSRLLEDFAARGGRVEVGALAAADVARRAAGHDLMVVASGRGSLAETFPRLPDRSPYGEPQRRLTSGLFRGVTMTEPLGVSFNVSPGHGEVFQAPFYSFAGRVSSIFVEAISGGGLEPIAKLRYDDDPAAFEATLLDVLREHAPRVYERIDRAEFGLTGPLDLLQGAITPTVRRGYARLPNGSYALAIGDVHVLNDPILGQGANAASHAAFVAGEAILDVARHAGPFDETFCRAVEDRIWAYARPVTEWTNAALHPPAPHVVEVFQAAAESKAIADEVIDNFNAPARNWAIFESPESTSAFLRSRPVGGRRGGGGRLVKVAIAGAGIGGLTTALALHQAGIEVDVFEQASEVRELGVGINMLPHAVKELATLGLLPALDRAGIRTRELILMNRFGQPVWQELRGLDAGYDVPQFSIHRGKLQGVLYRAALDRLGPGRIHTGRRLIGFEERGPQVVAHFERRADGERIEVVGDLLVGADGIHSALRSCLYPDEGPPAWNGHLLWRGAIDWPAYADGRTQIIAGGNAAKLVYYPIHVDPEHPDRRLTNWAIVARLGDGTQPPPRREDWSRPGRPDEALPFVRDTFQLHFLDPVALIEATGTFFEYPCCDRDPLPRWSFGRVTLLGDAAHPMYPNGSNGASQAILDARSLTNHLTSGAPVTEALAAYDAERRPATAEIVLANRRGGPERVIDLVEARAPDGFDDLDAVASYAEREAIVRGYASLAGYAQDQVNRRDG